VQAPDAGPVGAGAGSGIARRIAPPGQMHTALAPLPVAALRLPGETVEALSRLGLRRVGELTGMPRAALARRFGRQVVQRLDQALGAEPEPLGPAAPPLHFAARLSLPEPIGLEDDILAGIDRLLPALATRLREAGRGARRVGLEAHRADGSRARVEVGLARATDDPARIRPLLAMKLAGIDAGFGIDMLRVEAVQTELLPRGQARAPLAAPSAQEAATAAGGNAMDDLMGRLGARVGLEAITREHPASSHIPEKASKTLAAAWSEPAAGWPAPARARPLVHWRPEPVTAPESPTPPDRFRWRRRDLALAAATGPERIAPEWWLDEPDWRSGVRDYWRVTTATGERLWLYYAHGGTLSAGWFCQGSFA
jgi:protein ImuB